MQIAHQLKRTLNAALSRFNVKIESCTADRENERILAELVRKGNFDNPVFPILDAFKKCDPANILNEIARHQDRFAEFGQTKPGGDKYSFDNSYYSSPDADVLYAITRLFRPNQILEVGSGNSTMLFRHAITDGALKSRITSIDPEPRRNIKQFSDEVIRKKVEDAADIDIPKKLATGDILFIDSSHEIKPGNDVLYLFFNVLPLLQPGVLVHIHDIFLPYDYPKEWVVDYGWKWTEQYLVQAMLMNTGVFEVIWPGHFLQHHHPGFKNHFKHWRNAAASLWLRKT